MNQAHRWIGQHVEEEITARRGVIVGFGCSPHIGKSILTCSGGGERCTEVEWEPSIDFILGRHPVIKREHHVDCHHLIST